MAPSRARDTAWISLLALVTLVPVVAGSAPAVFRAFPLFVNQFTLPKLLVLVVALLVGYVSWGLALVRGQAGLRWSPRVWLLGLFVALVWLSAFLSPDTATAIYGRTGRLHGALELTLLGMVFVFALQMVSVPWRYRELAVVLTLTGAVMAGYGLLQAIGLDPISWGSSPFEARRLFGTLGNPDMFGGYLVGPLALAPVLAFTASDRRGRVTWWTVFVLIASAVLLTYVRGAWLAAVVGLGVLGWGAVSTRSVGRPDWRVLAAVLLAVVAAVSAIEVTAPAFTVLGRLTSAFSGSDPSVISRFVTWGVAVQAALAAPLLGTGPDTFLTAWYRFRPLSDLAVSGYERLNDDAHNFVLQLAATIGLPGTIAIVAFVALALGSGWHAVSSARDSRHAMLPIAWMAATVAGLVYALTGPMNIGASVVLAVSLGAVASPVVREVDLKPGSRVWLSMAAVLVLAAALVPIVRWTVADIGLATAVYSVSSGEQALALAERSAGLAPWSYQYAAAASDLKISRAQQALAAVGSGQVVPGSGEYDMAQGAIADAALALEQLTDDFPLEYEGFVKRAQYLNLLAPTVGPSAAEEALDVAQRAAAVYPRGLTAQNEQIAALFALGRYDEAMKLADTVVSWDPNQPKTAILRMLSYAAAGRTDEAREQSADLASRWPGDPAVQQALEDLETAIESSDAVE